MAVAARRLFRQSAGADGHRQSRIEDFALQMGIISLEQAAQRSMQEKEQQQEKIKIVVETVTEQPTDSPAPVTDPVTADTPSKQDRRRPMTSSRRLVLNCLPALVALTVIGSTVLPGLDSRGSLHGLARLTGLQLWVCFICATIFFWLGPGKAINLSRNPVTRGAFHGAFVGGILFLLILPATNATNAVTFQSSVDMPIAHLIAYLLTMPFAAVLIALGPGGLIGAVIGARATSNQTELARIRIMGCHSHSDELPAELQLERKAKVWSFANAFTALILGMFCAALIGGSLWGTPLAPVNNTFVLAVAGLFDQLATAIERFLSSIHI